MTKQQLIEKIANMTLQEKLLELTQYNYADLIRTEKDLTGEVITGVSQTDQITADELWRVGTILNARCGEDAQEIRDKRVARGITEPVVNMLDVIHGYRTIYPVPLALACSFDTELCEDCAEMAGIEAKYDGIDATFSPMVDMVRDARWGRVMESAGEDPLVCGDMGKAFIRGYHKAGIACCVKHFMAYGAAEAGRDYNTTDISDFQLKNFYLRGYEQCMCEKPDMVMTSFNALNGIPALGHKELMVDLLRDKWGFDGVLISDYAAVAEMINHGYTKDLREGAKVAIDAKLDIEMCTPAMLRHLPALVAEGKVSEAQIDEGVLRVLTMKNNLGLYDNPNGKTDFGKREQVTLCKEHRALAQKAAEESCVLLKNNGVLPLHAKQTAAFIGPFVSEKNIYGNWGCLGKGEDTVSVQQGVESILGKKIIAQTGCSHGLLETDESGIGAAVKAAQTADVIVACVGESMYNSGEAHSRSKLELPTVQKKLIAQLKALKKPLVLLVFAGRPLVLTEEEGLADAILYVWQPGTEGGTAIANLLYGRANPCGKTVMSFPRAVGQCPIYYNAFSTGRPRTIDEIGAQVFVSSYDDEKNAPLYPFGFGLSYTQFDYANFTVDKRAFQRGQTLTATVCVKNTGKVAGREVVQWYVRDHFGSCVRPVKELKGYQAVYLQAGEEKTVTFTITEELLAYATASGEWRAEEGEFTLFVGGNSRDCLAAKFELL